MARIWKFGDHVDTDQIVPGRFAPFMRPNEDVGTAAFIEAHPEFNKLAQPGDILVAGANFGCGSSREYAPLALKCRQLGAIVAKSFARIFYRNAINLGLPIFVDAAAAEHLEDGEQVEFSLATGVLTRATGNIELPPLPDFAQKIVEAGGIAAYVRHTGQFPIDATG